MEYELLSQLRQQNPVVLNISNFVTVQDVANGLNALGASPIMSQEIKETAAMVGIAQAVQLNLGAFTQTEVAHLRQMGITANQAQRPVVLDPVAVGAIAYRLQVAQQLLQEMHVNIIRGNAGEIAALGGFAWQSQGIDAGQGAGDLIEIAQTTAQRFHCVVILSGATDIVTDGQRVTEIYNGTPMLAVHVGSGDMLSSVTAAFAAVQSEDYYEAARMATLTFGTCGQLVMQHQPDCGPGSFLPAFLDQLYQIQVEELQQMADFQEVRS